MPKTKIHWAHPIVAASLALVAVTCLAGDRAIAQSAPADVAIPDVALAGVAHRFAVTMAAGDPRSVVEYRVFVDGRERTGGVLRVRDEAGAALDAIEIPDVVLDTGAHTVAIDIDGERIEHEVRAIPGWLSLLPPLLAIVLAIAVREVVLALVSGVFLGALVSTGWNPLTAVLRTVDHHVVNAVADTGHASILVFSLMLGGAIGVVSRSGGGIGLAKLVTRRATSSRRGLIATWALGVIIFFDDYANALLVGSTMRPITDRLRVSREKLAFLVDGTSAPVSSLAVVSSWIGVEVGYIADQYSALGISGDPYVVFLESIPYRFYPILMLFFSLLIIVMRRDFGPMHAAERRARDHGKLVGDRARPASNVEGEHGTLPEHGHWLDAAIPLGTIIVVAGLGMYLDGRSKALAEAPDVVPTLRAIFGNADSTKALLWSAFVGSGVAILTSTVRRSLTLVQALESWVAGVRSMVLACIILVLAWSLGQVCRELDTAHFVISAIGSWVHVGLLPVLVFLVAAAVSFATGTSWGTMAILFPLVIPLANDLAPGDRLVMLGAVSSILAGSVWGDHCSPISDTTVMSSMASGCDHVDHVRTQLPYALAVGAVSMVFGDLATGFELYPAWVGLVLGAGALVLLVRFVGKPVPDHVPGD